VYLHVCLCVSVCALCVRTRVPFRMYRMYCARARAPTSSQRSRPPSSIVTLDADRSLCTKDIAVSNAVSPRVDHSPSTLATGRFIVVVVILLSMPLWSPIHVTRKRPVSVHDQPQRLSPTSSLTTRTWPCGGASMEVDEVDLTSRDAVRNS